MINATALFLMLVNVYTIPPTQAATMTCLALHESKFDVKAINFNDNGTIDRGLFQINSIWVKELGIPETKLFNLHTNIRVALHIYEVQGVKAWAVHRRCK
jgi:hypothetical protein